MSGLRSNVLYGPISAALETLGMSMASGRTLGGGSLYWSWVKRSVNRKF
jgi:hypothetical protein